MKYPDSNYYFTLRDLYNESNDVFDYMAQTMSDKLNQEMTIQIKLLQNSDTNCYVLKSQPGKSSVQNKEVQNFDFEIFTYDEDWQEIIKGNLAPLRAVYNDRLAFAGNLKKGLKFLKLFAKN